MSNKSRHKIFYLQTQAIYQWVINEHEPEALPELEHEKPLFVDKSAVTPSSLLLFLLINGVIKSASVLPINVFCNQIDVSGIQTLLCLLRGDNWMLLAHRP